MSKSGSRYGRRSNWFKIHCLLQEQQQAGANIAAAAGLLRPHPYLTPLFHSPTNRTASRDTKSSESDSGASSADPEDEVRSSSAFSYLKPSSDRDYFSVKKLPSPASDSECFDRRKFISALVNAPSVSPASLPSISPGGGFPKWLPPFQGFNDPAAWRELWTRGPPTNAEPAPVQIEPIDLSVKAPQLVATLPPTDSDQELCIDVGVDEPVKPVPLDLTLDRQTTDVTN
ncbi:hypothetical protein BDFB_012192 [Asbolus verrucosus]|uniref:Protein embryonic gonad n=1 Tax=Asbolus verrucosus TaxID=1661398 RepID=A0A482W8H2_ASBVE|nr:hypothetical protein BDFB_012192 [Asbolus verrucosus]